MKMRQLSHPISLSVEERHMSSYDIHRFPTCIPLFLFVDFSSFILLQLNLPNHLKYLKRILLCLIISSFHVGSPAKLPFTTSINKFWMQSQGYLIYLKMPVLSNVQLDFRLQCSSH